MDKPKYYCAGTIVSFGAGKVTDEIICKVDKTFQGEKLCELLNSKDRILSEYVKIVRDLQNEQVKDINDRALIIQDAEKKLKNLETEKEWYRGEYLKEKRLRSEATTLCRILIERLEDLHIPKESTTYIKDGDIEASDYLRRLIGGAKCQERK